ncbi:hypothetical protein, partial [Aeromonas caviae]|uniref:hypothetical protein n=1 Tax=Aeromonas caviae TaxID=648 RepID=UPI0038D05B28
PGWREGDEQADRAWYACSPASELSGINGLGNGHPATDLINNAPLWPGTTLTSRGLTTSN